jgi:hypothetical protein|tara:strand:+ start:195 stop:1130 length:936 start_codon:yes stop_codon:yes gene_type:complete
MSNGTRKISPEGGIVWLTLGDAHVPTSEIDDLWTKCGVDTAPIRKNTSSNAFKRACGWLVDNLNGNSPAAVQYMLSRVGAGADTEHILWRATRDHKAKAVSAEVDVARFKLTDGIVIPMKDNKNMDYVGKMRDLYNHAQTHHVMSVMRHYLKANISRLNGAFPMGRGIFFVPLQAETTVNGKKVSNEQAIQGIQTLLDAYNNQYAVSSFRSGCAVMLYDTDNKGAIMAQLQGEIMRKCNARADSMLTKARDTDKISQSDYDKFCSEWNFLQGKISELKGVVEIASEPLKAATVIANDAMEAMQQRISNGSA